MHVRSVSTKIINRVRTYVEDLTTLRPEIKNSILNQSVKFRNIKINSANVFFPKRSRLKHAKYIFHTHRYEKLILTLPKSEVVVMGSWAERSFCKKNGFTFIPTFPIDIAVRLAMEGSSYSRLDSAVTQFIALFADECEKILFLFDDCMPLGSFFSLVAAQIKELKVVCVQHGFYTEQVYKNILSGRYSEFNFVLENSQREKIRSYTGLYYELGLPYDGFCQPVLSDQVFLIGHGGWQSANADYLLSLSLMLRIKYALLEGGVDVVYRPHPTSEPSNFVFDLFHQIDCSDKFQFLQGPRKIVIGFVSTLLYESKKCGHFVIAINVKEFPFKLAFEPDLILDVSETDRIEQIVSAIRKSMPSLSLERENLSSRLNKGIDWVKRNPKPALLC